MKKFQNNFKNKIPKNLKIQRKCKKIKLQLSAKN